MSAAGLLPRQAVRLALTALAEIAAVAVLVRGLGAGHQARQLLGLRFAGPARDPRAALEIAATNLRLLAAVLIAAWAVRRARELRRALDVILALLLALNVAMVGAALGAYGGRLLKALALHGPLELAAFALAGGAYLGARAGQLSAGRLAAAGLGSMTLICTAAVVESYLQIGAAT